MLIVNQKHLFENFICDDWRYTYPEIPVRGIRESLVALKKDYSMQVNYYFRDLFSLISDKIRGSCWPFRSLRLKFCVYLSCTIGKNKPENPYKYKAFGQVATIPTRSSIPVCSKYPTGLCLFREPRQLCDHACGKAYRKVFPQTRQLLRQPCWQLLWQQPSPCISYHPWFRWI